MLGPTRYALATVVCLGAYIGFTTGALLSQPTALQHGQCQPGSRGRECIVAQGAVEQLGASITYPAPTAQCADGSMSHSTTIEGTCEGHGNVVARLNVPERPADPSGCLLRIMGSVYSIAGPICLNAQPTP